MSQEKQRYLVLVNGKWRWRPTKAMRAYGFQMITFSAEMSDADLRRVRALNLEWDAARRGVVSRDRPRPPTGECVYVVGFAAYIKIGWTNNIQQRIEELECRLPEMLVIHASRPAGRQTERDLHKRFRAHRLRGEWFARVGAVAVWLEEGCPFDANPLTLGAVQHPTATPSTGSFS